MKRQQIFLLITSILLVCLFITNKSYCIDKESKIYKNIYIENIDVSNLTKNEAIEKLKKHVYVKHNIDLIHENKIYKLPLNEIDFKFNIEDKVNKALEIGRNDNRLRNIKTKINLTLGKNVHISLDSQYDKTKLNLYIKKLAKKLEIKPINAKIKLENNNFKIDEEKYGIGVNEKLLENEINKNIINKKFENINLPMEKLEPKFTYKKLEKINTLLGSYETRFNLYNENRASNIKLATKKTNGILIDSQDQFSFNSIIGRRSNEAGFKDAPIIINGEAHMGTGGGICQVSSTLYNAAIYSGLEIIQAKNHTIPSSYIEKGRDATVSYGDIDLIFKNNFKTPVLISNEVNGNKIVTNIYGSNEDKKTISIKTDIIKVIEYKTIEKENDLLYEGESQIETKGRNGYKVNTYRIYKNKDGLSNKELINESYYPPKTQVVIKGTKKKINNIKKLHYKII